MSEKQRKIIGYTIYLPEQEEEARKIQKILDGLDVRKEVLLSKGRGGGRKTFAEKSSYDNRRFIELLQKGERISVMADFFGVTRQTVFRYLKKLNIYQIYLKIQEGTALDREELIILRKLKEKK